MYRWILRIFLLSIFVAASAKATIWEPNISDKKYQNPVIYADYSDPDVIRVGDDFFMTASSFNCVPGLPILHSKDLVNWTLVNYALPELSEHFYTPRHGDGVWAPSLRYHKGSYYIFYGDPDFGIYQVKTKDPFGTWDKPVLVKSAHGNIDPCPFWDDDGKVYMVHAFAHSRAGVKSLLQINQLSADATRILDKGTIVYDGHEDNPTIEGSKLYKRNGYYYIFAPAGGVKEGWQTVLRSKSIMGPYEAKIVMAQGNTTINGPHQGAWVVLDSGESWFLHFQDKGPWGRIVHLQPMTWEDDWPIIGKDSDGDGLGEPVLVYQKPNLLHHCSKSRKMLEDDFTKPFLSLDWQWHANIQPNWFSLSANPGSLRLYAMPVNPGYQNLWQTPNLLLQKFQGPEFTASCEMDFQNLKDGERSGLVIMGQDYALLCVRKQNQKWVIEQVVCYNAEDGNLETMVETKQLSEQTSPVHLKVDVNIEAVCHFSFKQKDQHFIEIGPAFKAVPGRWIGAKVGVFCQQLKKNTQPGFVDYYIFKIQ